MSKAPPPPLRFLFHHPAHLVALGFGSGLARWAPGTAGTAFAWISYGWLRAWMPEDLGFAIFLLLAFAVGVAACQIAGRSLGVIDHGSIVWDEMVPFWGVLLMTPPEFAWQLGAFVAFRVFDITKPPPAGFFDRNVKNGFGVMMDDVVAAGYAVLAVAVVKSVLPA